jgi:hypothetical protein
MLRSRSADNHALPGALGVSERRLDGARKPADNHARSTQRDPSTSGEVSGGIVQERSGIMLRLRSATASSSAVPPARDRKQRIAHATLTSRRGPSGGIPRTRGVLRPGRVRRFREVSDRPGAVGERRRRVRAAAGTSTSVNDQSPIVGTMPGASRTGSAAPPAGFHRVPEAYERQNCICRCAQSISSSGRWAAITSSRGRRAARRCQTNCQVLCSEDNRSSS